MRKSRLSHVDDAEDFNHQDDDNGDQQKRKSIQSVEIGIKLLNALADSGGALRLREIAIASGLSRSQAHRYLLSYVNTGMVRQNSESGHYELGPLAIKVGLSALRSSEPVQIAGETLSKLVEETGYTGQLVVWSDFGPTLIRIRPGRKHVAMALQVGSVVPTLRSSAGKLFLALLPDRIAEDAMRREWSKEPRKPVGGWKTLLKKFQYEVREAGYATVAGETIPGLSAISAPVLNPDGYIALAITLVAHESESIINDTDLIRKVRREANEASFRLGYSRSAQDNDI